MYSSMRVVAPTALAAWSDATWMNIWYLRFLSMLLITSRALCMEWWFTRSSMWLQGIDGREEEEEEGKGVPGS